MDKPLVSIITPSFNCENSISRTIESVLNQTYQNWEMIITDDASSDNSCEKIKQISIQDKRIKLIKSTWNAGPAVARNHSIKAAKGRFIAFLDADDAWYPSKLEKQITFMLKKHIYFSYTGYRRIHENGNVLGYITAPTFVKYKDILKSNQIGCLTSCYDAQKLGKVYMPNIARCQDFGLWLKILKLTEKGYGINECLADYTVGVSSVSSNKVVAAQYLWRIYREVEKLTIIPSIYYFLTHLVNRLKRYNF